MRAKVMVAALSMAVAWAAPAGAQSPLDGPLAAPDAPAAATPKPHAKAKAKKPRHVASKPAPDVEATPERVPAAAEAPSRRAPADPLSLGMKWNGSNDTAGQTRSQNLDGGAFGSGAEVGMKLHF